jgi:homoserine O-acetyltransferase
MKLSVHAVAVLALFVESAAAQTRQAALGRCQLELRGTIENCRLAYRTFGALDANRRNAILIPTWFTGRADAWLPFLGPNGYVDTTGFFVIVVESLGAGASSSPTNTVSQHGLAFPEITIGDMVQAAYRLATEELKLSGLHAVVGISLGGLQAFEWGVRYPDYARRVVSIVGNPRQASYGRALFELVARVSEDGARGTVPLDSTTTTLARLLTLASTSPAAVNAAPSDAYASTLASQARELRGIDLYEWACHARAILRHDIARNFGGDLRQAARAWKARALVVTATHDHTTDPQPAQTFARLIGADTLVLDSPAGHSAVFGDSTAKATVRRFLKN